MDIVRKPEAINAARARRAALPETSAAAAPETANDAFVRKGAFVALAVEVVLAALALVALIYMLIWR